MTKEITLEDLKNKFLMDSELIGEPDVDSSFQKRFYEKSELKFNHQYFLLCCYFSIKGNKLVNLAYNSCSVVIDGIHITLWEEYEGFNTQLEFKFIIGDARFKVGRFKKSKYNRPEEIVFISKEKAEKIFSIICNVIKVIPNYLLFLQPFLNELMNEISYYKESEFLIESFKNSVRKEFGDDALLYLEALETY